MKKFIFHRLSHEYKEITETRMKIDIKILWCKKTLQTDNPIFLIISKRKPIILYTYYEENEKLQVLLQLKHVKTKLLHA